MANGNLQKKLLQTATSLLNGTKASDPLSLKKYLYGADRVVEKSYHQELQIVPPTRSTAKTNWRNARFSRSSQQQEQVDASRAADPLAAEQDLLTAEQLAHEIMKVYQERMRTQDQVPPAPRVPSQPPPATRNRVQQEALPAPVPALPVIEGRPGRKILRKKKS